MAVDCEVDVPLGAAAVDVAHDDVQPIEVRFIIVIDDGRRGRADVRVGIAEVHRSRGFSYCTESSG
jgi:hypothetical protein